MNILEKIHIKKPTPEQLLQGAGVVLSLIGMAIDKKVKANEAKAAEERLKEKILNDLLKNQNS